MRTDTPRGTLYRALGLSCLLGVYASGCQRHDSDTEVCALCEPHAGGETGDFGAILAPEPCEGALADFDVSEEEATGLGFDMAEIRRRVARPVDKVLLWKASDLDEESLGGRPATGYMPETRLLLRFSAPRRLHYVGPDPAVCDGTTCQLPNGGTERQDQCTRRLDVDVDAEVETLDGAVRAALKGQVWVMHPEYNGPGASAIWREPRFSTRADLTEVTGTLRLYPKPGAERYVGRLFVYGFLGADDTEGHVSPEVRTFGFDNNTADGYRPLTGVF